MSSPIEKLRYEVYIISGKKRAEKPYKAFKSVREANACVNELKSLDLLDAKVYEAF